MTPVFYDLKAEILAKEKGITFKPLPLFKKLEAFPANGNHGLNSILKKQSTK